MSYYSSFASHLVQPFAPQSVAYFRTMTTQLDFIRQAKIDRYIRGLIADGVYSKIEFGFIHRLPVEQQSLVSFADGNAILAKAGTPTFTANVGWTSVGANASRLDTPTNYSAFTKYLQNDCTFGTWLTTAPSQNANAMGTSDNYNWLICNYLGAHKYGRVNMTSSTSLSLGGGGTGLHMFNRSASNAVQLYKDGASHGTSTTASTAPTATPFTILNCNNQVPANGNVHAFSFIGASLTAAEHLALYNRTNALLTEL